MTAPVRAGILVATTVVLATIVVLSADWLTDAGKEAASATIAALTSIGTTWVVVRTAGRSSGLWRRTWTLVAVCTGLWAAGNVTAIIVGSLSDDVVFPSAADVFWVPALPVAIAALLAIPGRLSWRGSSRVSVDSVLLAAALLYVTWELLLGDAYATADLRGSAKALLLVYWVLDTTTFATAVNVLLRCRRQGSRHLVLICTGFILYTVTDAVFLKRSLDGDFALGSPTDVGWIAGQLVLAIAALGFVGEDAPAFAPKHRQRASDRRILGGTIVSFGAFLTVFVVNAASGANGATGLSRVIEIVLLVGTASMFVYTQLTTLRQNLTLTSGLEHTVAERTRELTEAVELQDLTLRTVADGILGFHDGRIVLANDAACEMLHLTRPQVLGRIVPDVLTMGPADHSLLREILTTLGADRPFSVESETIIRTDGTSFSAAVTVAPVPASTRR